MEREQEVPLVSALLMVVVGDVRSLGAIKEPRVEQRIARPMVEVGGVNF